MGYVSSAALAHGMSLVLRLLQIANRAGDSFRVPLWNDHASANRTHEVRLKWKIADDDWHAARHCFEQFQRSDPHRGAAIRVFNYTKRSHRRAEIGRNVFVGDGPDP